MNFNPLYEWIFFCFSPKVFVYSRHKLYSYEKQKNIKISQKIHNGYKEIKGKDGLLTVVRKIIDTYAPNLINFGTDGIELYDNFINNGEEK